MGNQVERLKKLEEALLRVSKEAWASHGLAWLPIICSVCNGIVSQKMASNRLVCLGCNREFELKQV